MSESDNNLMNSATGCQINPRLLVSPGRTDSYPSISGLRPTEESTYNRTGARSQSQSLLSEIRIANVLDRFQSLKMEIDNWEYELRTQCISFDEINEQFDSLFKGMHVLAKEAILANVDLSVCGQISDCKTTVQRRRNALFDLEMREGMDSLHQDSKMEDGLRDKIDLSIRGQVVDNAGQRSPRLVPGDNYEINRDEIVLPIRGQVVDNAGQQSPQSLSIGIDDDCLGRGQVIDNAGQRSPRLFPGGNCDIYMVDEFTDEDGFADPRDLARSQRQLDLQRTESNSPHMEDLIDLTSPTENSRTDYSQVEKSNQKKGHESVNQGMGSLRGNWDVTINNLLTNQEQRIRRL